MKQTFLLLFLLTSLLSFSQKKLDKLLKTHNTESIPYIFPEDLKNESSSYTLLDSREPHEFKVSHLKNAICVGYDFFNLDSIASQLPAKDSKIVVYCSLGIRSEDVAEKLKAAGYTNVHNLYGGIFEWKNSDFTIYNEEETETEDVHTFSKEWSKWLKKGNKIYE
ncbi:rhodanese-like domain-containing protein [Neotamlana laminarinivorans]|uniref:Rhodanese-like domain-containing protein n=1 Tax=Neotamlana laminarinivorans TaxID=2883124 RepID=A0A9X1I374_9FLAO|nr:rhodanese-like domain-containing protein [Tamlana laminarinivorans]MCB4799164.1 rhodanese-like domain-containing protein [Tamlana laminarinivorans]